MPERPTLNDLRGLGAVLPPSERLQGAETADVLSAIAAVVTHGQGILEAAAQGPQAVAQFFHDHISDNRPEGANEPVKGEGLTQPVPTVQPQAQVGTQAIDYQQLAAAIVAEQNRAKDAPASSDVTPTGEASSTSAPAQADTPAVTTADTSAHESQAATSDEAGIL